MSNPRLPTFYVNFFRAVRSCEPTTYRSLRNPPRTSGGKLRSRGTRSRAQSTYQNRYGPAATEGLPPPPKPQESLETQRSESSSKEQANSSKPDKQSKRAEVVQSEQEAERATEETKGKVQDEPITIDVQANSQTQTESDSTSKLTDAQDIDQHPDLDKEGTHPTRELDMVLSIPSPNELKGKASRHPHLEASPYEHNFDTYSLVQDLASTVPGPNADPSKTDQQAFTHEQATTLMKAIRQMLSNNLDIAKEGLVSKSDVENESYLFRAACSELRTTLQASRFAENQRQRSNRAQLQHEHDILNQKINQDMMNMREELKGLFNDRKMGLQEEKRKIDSKISEINYEITVLLNSEAKSEVEGLRWVLTRRAAMAIVMAAFMTLTALQYYSIKSREAAEIEKKRKAANKATEERMKETEVARYTTPSRSSGTQTTGPEGLLEETLG